MRVICNQEVPSIGPANLPALYQSPEITNQLEAIADTQQIDDAHSAYPRAPQPGGLQQSWFMFPNGH